MDHPAYKEFSDTVPWADGIAFAALIAEFIGFPTCLFDAIDDHFKRRQWYSFHYA
jgi:hypothetical protein